jgi:hypothetical protein
MTTQLPSVGVIGAGPSGLPVCKTLSEFNVPYDCFEMSGEVGGNWVLRNPIFDDQLLGTSGDDVALYRNVMHPRYHNLFIVGMYRPLCAFWPLAEQQARWIAPLLTGEYALPRQPELDRQTFPILKIPAFNCAFYGHDLRLDTRRGKKRVQQSNFQPPIQALAWRYAERGEEARLMRSRRQSA